RQLPTAVKSYAPLRRQRAVCLLVDQPRAVAGAHAFARPRAGLRSFAFPSIVMDLPREVPKSAACGRSSTGRSDKPEGGFELLWRPWVRSDWIGRSPALVISVATPAKPT